MTPIYEFLLDDPTNFITHLYIRIEVCNIAEEKGF